MLRRSWLLLGRHLKENCALLNGVPTQQVRHASDVADQVDCIVVGAGVVGLACARAIAQSGKEVLLLEAASSWGTATSSRHSEVIHAGIYYPTNSLKARLCVEGKHVLYEYCAAKDIPYKRITKMIVATNETQVPQLSSLQQQAAANGIPDLQLLSGQEARDLEPGVRAAAALLSPSTGILDSHSYMEALLADAEGTGAALAVNAMFKGSKVAGEGRHLVEVEDVSSGQISRLEARWIINAAGLQAQEVSRSVSGVSLSSIPARYLAKGHYFSLSGQCPFKRLIYPLPEPGGLGVHLTLDLAGQAKFGPDVKWVDQINYDADPARRDAFAAAIKSYYPGLDPAALHPSYTGIRPKISGPEQPAADFCIQGPKEHGRDSFVALYGIESPGLTSSMAIGAMVAAMLR